MGATKMTFDRDRQLLRCTCGHTQPLPREGSIWQRLDRIVLLIDSFAAVHTRCRAQEDS